MLLQYERLVTELHIQNTGGSPFSFTAALHSYFAVPDVEQAAVRMLEGLEYLDKVWLVHGEVRQGWLVVMLCGVQVGMAVGLDRQDCSTCAQLNPQAPGWLMAGKLVVALLLLPPCRWQTPAARQGEGRTERL